jgi:hypothetical protein
MASAGASVTRRVFSGGIPGFQDLVISRILKKLEFARQAAVGRCMSPARLDNSIKESRAPAEEGARNNWIALSDVTSRETTSCDTPSREPHPGATQKTPKQWGKRRPRRGFRPCRSNGAALTCRFTPDAHGRRGNRNESRPHDDILCRHRARVVAGRKEGCR